MMTVENILDRLEDLQLEIENTLDMTELEGATLMAAYDARGTNLQRWAVLKHAIETLWDLELISNGDPLPCRL